MYDSDAELLRTLAREVVMSSTASVRHPSAVINEDTPITIRAMVSSVANMSPHMEDGVLHIWVYVSIDFGELRPVVKVLVPAKSAERVANSQLRGVTLQHVSNGTRITAIDFGAEVGVLHCASI